MRQCFDVLACPILALLSVLPLTAHCVLVCISSPAATCELQTRALCGWERGMDEKQTTHPFSLIHGVSSAKRRHSFFPRPVTGCLLAVRRGCLWGVSCRLLCWPATARACLQGVPQSSKHAREKGAAALALARSCAAVLRTSCNRDILSPSKTASRDQAVVHLVAPSAPPLTALSARLLLVVTVHPLAISQCYRRYLPFPQHMHLAGSCFTGSLAAPGLASTPLSSRPAGSAITRLPIFFLFRFLSRLPPSAPGLRSPVPGPSNPRPPQRHRAQGRSTQATARTDACSPRQPAAAGQPTQNRKAQTIRTRPHAHGYQARLVAVSAGKPRHLSQPAPSCLPPARSFSPFPAFLVCWLAARRPQFTSPCSTSHSLARGCARTPRSAAAPSPSTKGPHGVVAHPPPQNHRARPAAARSSSSLVVVQGERERNTSPLPCLSFRSRQQGNKADPKRTSQGTHLPPPAACRHRLASPSGDLPLRASHRAPEPRAQAACCPPRPPTRLARTHPVLWRTFLLLSSLGISIEINVVRCIACTASPSLPPPPYQTGRAALKPAPKDPSPVRQVTRPRPATLLPASAESFTMHQQTRHPSRGGYSPASSPQTNPTRTNNPRDAPTSRSRATSEAAPPGPSLGAASAGDGGTSAAPAAAPVSGPTRESIKKLDQIIQVRTATLPEARPRHLMPPFTVLLNLANWHSAAELLSQSCSSHRAVPNPGHAVWRQPWAENEQMGKLVPDCRCIAEKRESLLC